MSLSQITYSIQINSLQVKPSDGKLVDMRLPAILPFLREKRNNNCIEIAQENVARKLSDPSHNMSSTYVKKGRIQNFPLGYADPIGWGGEDGNICRIESNIRVEQNIYFMDTD